MSRPTLVAITVLALVLAPITAVGAATGQDRASATGPTGAATDIVSGPLADAQTPNPCVRTTREKPERETLLSIQGARGSGKTDALLVGFEPDGEVIGVHNATDRGRWWAYDVDPLSNGNLLFSSTEPGISVVEELDPETGEHVSVREFPDVLDSHDADLINGDELLMNDMSDEGEDRVTVYNLTREEVVWEYRFDDHPEEFPRDEGGDFEEDWTHNNDVEKVDDDLFMVSVRNFDQVVAINRSTKEIEWELGGYGEHEVLDDQHNPDYLESEDGRATVLVADSLNDRVVEYERVDDGTGEAEWEQTWVTEGGGLDEPRDADRLPNGNTLVADRRAHRLVEISPQGEVVWEVFAPWQPYDAERNGTVDESSGPTMRDLNATGTYELNGTSPYDESDVEPCYEFLQSVDSDRLLPGDAHVPTSPTDRPETVGGSAGSGDGGDSDGSGGSDGSESDGDDGSDGSDDESLLGTSSNGDSDDGSLWLIAGAIALVAIVAVGGVVLWRRR